MLSHCLNPMELDTEPWPKKSSTLCSLLLLFASFFVLGVPGQAAEIVGLGKHTLLKDGKVNLNTSKYDNYIGVKSIDLNEYKTLFPGACDVTINDDFIELQYKGELCTVDLLSYFNDEIKFKAGVRSKAGLSNCLDSGFHLSHSYNNSLPFVYSKNNYDIEKFSTGGPFENKNKEECDEEACERITGTCSEWTSLEVSWSKVNSTVGTSVYGHIHLIREGKSANEQTKRFNKSDNEMTFDLEIKAEEITFHRQSPFNPADNAVCSPKNNTIVKPAAWTIKNTRMEYERLLVFSLLPPNVSIVYTGAELNKTIIIPSRPICELFIQFSTEHYRLLTVIPTPTCTTTSTTTQTTTTTTTEAPTTTTSCPTMKPDPVTTATKSTTTTRPTEKTCPVESKTGLYVALVIGWLLVVLLLCVGGISIWFLMKQTDKEIEVTMPEQGKDKYLRALYDAEVKKKGPVAVGTFDKWKENRKKNEKTAAKGLSSKRDGNTAKKKKAVKKEQPKSKNDIVQEKYEKEWYQYVYSSEYLPELKKKGIAVVGTFDEWKKNRPPPAAATMIEQSPMTKTAMGTDKSVVDKGKSSTGVDGKKSTTVEDIVQPFAEDPVIPDPPKKAEKVKDEEWTLEENEYDDDGNLLPKVEKGGIDCPPSTESEREKLSI